MDNKNVGSDKMADLRILSHDERRDLLLYICYVCEKIVSYTRCQQILYLLDKNILKKNNLAIGYKFELSIGGPSDQEVVKNLISLHDRGLVLNDDIPDPDTGDSLSHTHELHPTEYGKNYVRAIDLEEKLRLNLGEEVLKEIVDSVKDYNRRSINDIMKESTDKWFGEHPEIREYLLKVGKELGMTPPEN